MVQVYYNSREAACKSPFGAVSSGTEVTFTVFISRRITPCDVKLHIAKDGSDAPLSFEMEWQRTVRGFDAYTVAVSPPESGLYWYYFTADGIHIGKSGDAAAINGGGAWQLTVYGKGYETPDWIKGGVFYQIFVDRFFSYGTVVPKKSAVMHKNWNEPVCWKPDENGEILNNDFFGGNLAGITEKLPYLKKLGVTCLYLSPVFEAYSNHKYDTADYMKIDSMFGDEAAFKKMCDVAHSHGIKVILDGVFNHVGADSVYFNKNGTYDGVGAYQSQNSPYSSWFEFARFPDDYSCWWGFKTLPAVNKNDPSYIDFITGENGVIAKWMRLGADGWRLDVADELPDGFIEKIRARIKREKKDGFLLGEVWEDASTKMAYGVRRRYFLGTELDSVMNYPFRVSIIDFVRNRNSEGLAGTVHSICENYPPQAVNCLMNILGTHDSDRVITALAGDLLIGAGREEKAAHSLSKEQYKTGIKLLKMASALQMTLPGVPCIYYGDEAGVQGYNDPFNRTTFPWGKEDKALTAWYAKLCALRAKHGVFENGTFRLVSCKSGFFAFLRENGSAKVAVAVNRDSVPHMLNFSAEATNLISGEEIGGTKYILAPDEILIAEVKAK